ncbi:CHC2 zinc finger domain-containing protein [Escherichia coli]
MAGTNPTRISLIKNLLARADIVDLIDARVKLKKRARISTRVVHSTTETPSFTVNGEKNSFTTALDVARTATRSTS